MDEADEAQDNPEKAAQKILIQAGVRPQTSFALVQNSIPVITSIIINNNSSNILNEADLVISASPAFFTPLKHHLPQIAPFKELQLDVIDLRCDQAQLARLTEAEKGWIKIKIVENGVALAESTWDIELLARNQWGGLEFPDSVTAFVQPNEPAVENILGHAITKLRQFDENAAFDGYVRDKKAVWAHLTAVWEGLLDQRLGYILPPADFGDQGQKIRLPAQIMESRLGTDLDISLLFASCLEQADLRPIIVFTKAHAFAGCWLSQSSFSATVIDDISALRKRLDLREIAVFETELLTRQEPRITFSKACERAESFLSERKEPDFVCLVDVARARSQGWRPLASLESTPLYPPQNRMSGDVVSVSDPIILEFPSDLVGDLSCPAPASEPALKSKLDVWQRKLLDLSLRNNLLNFRSSKRHVEILAPEPGNLEDSLAAGEKFKILSAQSLTGKDQRSRKLYEDRHQEDSLPSLALKLAKEKKLLVDIPENELSSRLLTLYREDRSAVENGGVGILYLVFGFLSWRSDKKNENCRAPLILMPARLERSSVLSGFTLSLSGDEPKFNLTLLEMLRQDFALKALDGLAHDLPTDNSGLDIDGIWKMVSAAVINEPGWEVSRTVALGLFSFAKYLMWKDLSEQTEEFIKRSPVVKLLLNTKGEPYDAGSPFVEPNELDTKLSPQNTYCPLPADSSQMSAINSAAQGKDFVLIGPPGTGKSQTIANMIAQCLAESKTVLFVAEKAAALNVVYRRLKAIGLEEFCLELHSNKASKQQVVAMLKKASDSSSGLSAKDWNDQATQLATKRDILNRYVAELHKERPNGLKVYEAFGDTIKNFDTPVIALPWSHACVHDRQAYTNLFEAIRKVEDQAPKARYLQTGPLRFIGQDDWSPSWEDDELLPAAEALRTQWAVLEQCESEAIKVSGLPLANVWKDDLSAWKEILELLPKAYGRDWSFAVHPEAEMTLRHLDEILSAIKEYGESRSQAYESLNATSALGANQLQALERMRLSLGKISEIGQRLTEENRCAAPRPSGEGVERLVGIARENISVLVCAWRAAQQPDSAKALLSLLRDADKLVAEYELKRKNLSVSYDEAKAFALDPAELNDLWEEAMQSWWAKKFILKRRVLKALQNACSPKDRLDCAADLKCLNSLKSIKTRLDKVVSREQTVVRECFEFWRNTAAKRAYLRRFIEIVIQTQEIVNRLTSEKNWLTEWESELCATVDFGFRMGRCLKHMSTKSMSATPLTEIVGRLLGADNSRLAPDGQIINALKAFLDAAQNFQERFKALQKALHTTLDWFDNGDSGSEIAEICSQIIANKADINTWCAWLRTSDATKKLELNALTEAIINGDIKPGQGELTLRVNYARWWLKGAISSSEILRKFVASDHERAINDFKKLDEGLSAITGQEIVRLLRTSPVSTQIAKDERTLLDREFAKKKKHRPIRQLIKSLPTLLPSLAPCFLMSPLSIAQYLEADRPPFDLVIFDEASQIPVWDAIGAISRGKKVVVVGDPKQLPPTSFFQKVDNEDTDDYEAAPEADQESILDECLGAGLPKRSLRWHYRSRHESLIAFSNSRYYNGELVTFPSPGTDDRAVSFHFADGVYDRGKSRTNPIEARALVTDLIGKLRSDAFQNNGHPSIGVVTFNSQQQTLIEDLLDAERRKDPSLDRFFNEAPNEPEPVMVKNLENIQGDERDYMYFSIGFAPDATGHMTLNFGAINKDGGERRLNVAITRAREALLVYASFYPEKILINNTKAKGVHDLRSFIEYAQNGPRSLAGYSGVSRGDFESPFEEAVAKALADKGWRIIPQIGVSTFRIDLGVVDPDEPGRYLAGVECDGATYHRQATARDRDRLRESVLRGLGWEIIRIWSTEWWFNQLSATEKLHSKLLDVQKRVREQRCDRKAFSAAEATTPPKITEPESTKSSQPLHPSLGQSKKASSRQLQAGLWKS